MLELGQWLFRCDQTGPGCSRYGGLGSFFRRVIGVGEHRIYFPECGWVYLDAASSCVGRSCTVGGDFMMCCCGHDEAEHLGGPDLDSAALESLRVMRPAGDGGMCRARVGAGGGLVWARCECFNFCDCYTVTADDGQIRAGDLL